MLDRILKNTDILYAFGIIFILGLMIIPLSPFLLDFFLAINIAFAILILISSLYINSPLEISAFPGLLLVLTIFRLSLNISSTRLILIDGYAGQVIETFGSFVVGGSYVVGFIVFLILIIIQFMVIVKGSGRISEVAARFTLDAMPGKQMAIDADLNSGLINEAEARNRRDNISREAEYTNVHFALPYAEQLGLDDVFIFGKFNNYGLNDENKMVYNEANGMMEGAIKMKQGFYNYKYVIKHDDGIIDLNTVSGNFHFTENNYLILVYYRNFGDLYDSIIGVGSANSRNISN